MYDKIEYWGNRKDPNSELSKKTSDLQILWTKNFINEDDNILEYGPGVLRLLDLYKGRKKINFYDISTQYKNSVEKKCKDNNILIENYIIDNSGEIKTKFKNEEFDVIICSEVFLHSPNNEIEKLMVELARIGKKVIVTTWYEKGKSINTGHCWTRDYSKLIKDNNLELVYWEENLFNNKQLGFIYKK